MKKQYNVYANMSQVDVLVLRVEAESEEEATEIGWNHVQFLRLVDIVGIKAVEAVRKER
jgi:hypothetical protein